MGYSVTYLGIITFCIGWIFEKVGVPFVKLELQQTIEFLVKFAGVLVAFYGRWRRGDIDVFGGKK